MVLVVVAMEVTNGNKWAVKRKRHFFVIGPFGFRIFVAFVFLFFL